MTPFHAQASRGLRRFALAGALGVVASLALAACSSGTGSSTATLPTVFPSSAMASAPSVPSSPESSEAPSSPATEPADSAEVQAYVDAMSPLAAEEQDLLDRYGSVTGANYTDDETTYNTIVDLLPDVQAFILELESVPVPEGAIAAAHADLVSGWNIQSEGMTLVAAAIKDQDLTAIAAGNTKLAEGRALLRKAQSGMNEALAASS